MNVRSLNFHHLLYFFTIAREGNLRRASEALHVSQPSLSAQLKLLEAALGTTLFTRTTRRLSLTESGQIIYAYAEEIFNLGQELISAVHQDEGRRTVRLNVGIVDSVPKMIVHRHLAPVFRMSRPVHVVCREGSLQELVVQLADHRLDVVIADEPSTSALRVRTFNHRLSRSKVVLCATSSLARALKKHFPQSLNAAPAVLPVAEMPLRRQLEQWFEAHGVRPQVVAEVADTALMKDLAAQGLGFIPVYSIIEAEVLQAHQLQRVGTAAHIEMEVYAITAERRIHHPGLLAIQDG